MTLIQKYNFGLVNKSSLLDCPPPKVLVVMIDADAYWDAGDMGCGELLMELRFKMAELKSGQVFKLTVRDPGAPEEMPSWCRMTGHKLLKAEHPEYLLEKR